MASPQEGVGSDFWLGKIQERRLRCAIKAYLSSIFFFCICECLYLYNREVSWYKLSCRQLHVGTHKLIDNVLNFCLSKNRGTQSRLRNLLIFHTKFYNDQLLMKIVDTRPQRSNCLEWLFFELPRADYPTGCPFFFFYVGGDRYI